MNTSEPSPRVNAALAAKMQGKRVLLVGRAVEGDQLACSDEGLVSVKVSSEGPLPVGSCVEIRGIMESHNVLAEDSRLDFGNAFGE